MSDTTNTSLLFTLKTFKKINACNGCWWSQPSTEAARDLVTVEVVQAQLLLLEIKQD